MGEKYTGADMWALTETEAHRQDEEEGPVKAPTAPT